MMCVCICVYVYVVLNIIEHQQISCVNMLCMLKSSLFYIFVDTQSSIDNEIAAAVSAFSPSKKGTKRLCKDCGYENHTDDPDCENCLSSLPVSDKRHNAIHVNIDTIPVYTTFKYKSSRNTARIYVYDDVSKE